MSILVAGGAGYIGSHMVKDLIENGEDVVVADNLSTGHRDAINPKAKFYEGDIRDRQFLDKIFDNEDITAVVHFAAFSIVPESMSKPLKYFDNNTGGMITLLEAMHDHDIKYIVFSSTAATYGVPEHMPIKETDPQKPINPYGLSKLMMEEMMDWADKAYGIKFVALRYFNVAGAAPLHLIRFPNSKAVSIYNCSTNFLYFSSFAITSFARSSISSTSPSSASKIFSSS